MNMSNENSGKWGRDNWDRRGRGHNRGYGRGGNRGSWRGGYFNRGGRGGYRDDRNAGHGNWNSNQQWRRPKRDTPGKRLNEDAIGVTKYISDHEGFFGIIKSR